MTYTGREDGFSLVELLVGSVLTTIVLGSLASLLTNGQGTFEAQQAQIELRQAARVAIERIGRETRVMGYRTRNVPEALLQATATTLQFAADIDDGSNEPPCGAAFESAVNGGVERITYRMSVGKLVRDVDCWDGIGWSSDSVAQVMVDNLPATPTLFRYFDTVGAELLPAGSGLTSVQRAQVRSIAISLEMTDTSRSQVVGDTNTHQQISAQVQLHNLR